MDDSNDSDNNYRNSVMEQTIYKLMADERKKIFFLTEEEGKRKKKNSFEPDSNQRPKDDFIISTVLRSTN